MNEKQLIRVINHLAEGLVPDTVDLWPAIQLRLKASKNYSTKGDLSMNTALAQSRHLRLASISLLVFIVVGLVSFLTIPPLRAAALELFGFTVKTNNIQVIFTPTPAKTINPAVVPTLVQTVEVQMKATQQQKKTQASPDEEYQIKLPTRLPKGWKMENIQIGMNGNAWVSFVYEPGGSLLDLIINPAQDMEGKILGPEGKIETITMGKIPAEYVRGTWTTNQGHSILHLVKPEQAKDLAWGEEPGMRKLRWVDGNLNYLLVASGSRPGEEGYLGKNDLAIMAASFKPVPPGPWPTAQVFTPNNGVDEVVAGKEEAILTPSQLEDKVGFDILEPSFLPENYQYHHGNYYNIGGSAVELFYSCGITSDNPWGHSFYIYQVKMSEAEYQFELEHAPKDEVGESAQIKTVMINGVPAEYIKGEWREVMDNSSGTPVPVKKVWDNDLNRFKLTWYTNGFFYKIIGGYSDETGLCTLTGEDIIAIAQSLK